MKLSLAAFAAIVVGCLLTSPAEAATKGVLGSKFQVKDPGSPSERRASTVRMSLAPQSPARPERWLSR